jgi:hypothetical protein
MFRKVENDDLKWSLIPDTKSHLKTHFDLLCLKFLAMSTLKCHLQSNHHLDKYIQAYLPYIILYYQYWITAKAFTQNVSTNVSGYSSWIHTMSLFPSQCNTIYIKFFLSSSLTTCFGLTWPSSSVDHYAKQSHCINNYFGYTVLFCFYSDTH